MNVVITGASRGIGKKIADYLSSIKKYTYCHRKFNLLIEFKIHNRIEKLF